MTSRVASWSGRRCSHRGPEASERAVLDGNRDDDIGGANGGGLRRLGRGWKPSLQVFPGGSRRVMSPRRRAGTGPRGVSCVRAGTAGGRPGLPGRRRRAFPPSGTRGLEAAERLLLVDLVALHEDALARSVLARRPTAPCRLWYSAKRRRVISTDERDVRMFARRQRTDAADA